MLSVLYQLIVSILIYRCVILGLLILYSLIIDYFILLDNLIDKLLIYPTIYYLVIALGMGLLFAYMCLREVLQHTIQ
jgi:hypothetical protein